MPSFISPVAADLISKLLQVDPTKRLGRNGVQEVKDHPFFSGIDWESILACKKKGPLGVRYDPDSIKLRALNLKLDEENNDPKALNLPDFSYYEFSQGEDL